MNQVQQAYAIAKAAYEVARDMYNTELEMNAHRQAIMDEQFPLLDFEPGTPEYARACDIEDELYDMEKMADEHAGLTPIREALDVAEQSMVEWSFATLKSIPQAFKMVGIEYKDIEGLLAHMQNRYSPIRTKLVDLAFRYAA